MQSTTSLALKHENFDRAYYCRIGKQPVSTPLITLPQLKAHLSLLRAIQALRSVVEEGTDERFPEYVKLLQPPQRWIWMIGLAIDRYARCRSFFFRPNITGSTVKLYEMDTHGRTSGSFGVGRTSVTPTRCPHGLAHVHA